MKKKYIVLIFLIVLIISAIFVTRYYLSTEEKKEVKNVSVVVYGNSKERWDTLERGIKMAALEENAEITFVTMSDEKSITEQNELITKEIENGADALIVAACGGDRQKGFFQKFAEQIPMILVESGTEGVTTIRGLDYDMGYYLADQLVKNESDIVKIAIVSEGTQRDSVDKRLKGFEDRIAMTDIKTVNWIKYNNINAKVFVQNNITREAVDAVVAFDNANVEGAVDAIVNLDKDIDIYGVANSEKAVYYLDKGIIKALAYQDEYSMGYMAAKTVITGTDMYLNGKAKTIEYKIVSSEDVYDEKTQRLLFPVVK